MIPLYLNYKCIFLARAVSLINGCRPRAFVREEWKKLIIINLEEFQALNCSGLLVGYFDSFDMDMRYTPFISLHAALHDFLFIEPNDCVALSNMVGDCFQEYILRYFIVLIDLSRVQ